MNSDDDIALKLKDIEERINEAKGQETKKHNTNAAAGINLGFRLATELIGGVVVGAGLGCFFDMAFKTEPVFFIVFILMGGAAGVLNAYRAAKGIEKETFKNEK